MAKGKTPTPQELYKARKQREEQEKLAFLPPGLYNHGNTCFMNSVLQGLIATRLLSELVHFAPIPPSTQAHSATLLASRRSPQLTNGRDLAGEHEKQWVNTMPIGDMFVNVLGRAWEAQYHRKRESLSPKSILTALGKKYDQYLDFAQQDAHEFLRILLDAMSMEELDIIKKSNPPPPKKRRRTSAPSPLPPEDAPIALADMIFGGKLASILICQKCKHVSQTYEDFSDLSLSIKQEDYDRVKKRDRPWRHNNPEIRLSRASHSLERKPESNGPKSHAVTGVTRSKSPKPPKPSAGETAYLRQILADVSTGGDAVWLKLGNSLPDVEECLRMFTAVEVLDGDNMVGCRRCWKIANGQYVPRVRRPDEDYANSVNEDGDSDDSADNHESPVVAHNVETIRRRPTLPTSLSTPTAESSSSLPLVTPPSSSSDSALGRSRFGDDTDTITPPSSASSVQSLSLSLDQEVETPPATKVTIIPPTPNADTFKTTEDGERNVSSLESIVESVEKPTSSPPLNGIRSLTSPRCECASPTTSTPPAASSDVSATSGQISSAAVSEDARSDTEGGASTKSRTKPKKPKPVIMRPAYKRYLIAVPPPVLVIHLKRFQQVSKTMISFSTGFKKLDDYVTFPETLDLTPFLAPKKEDYGLRSKKGTGKGKQPAERCMYRLYAVVVHIGNMYGGHYVSYVALPTAGDIPSILNTPSGTPTPTSPPTSPMANPAAESSSERQWAYISDTVVRLTTLEEVLKAKAYICMYERV
ncbi:hypothetical protein B0H14DRAFT_3089398 [Mycena olivaceomarginata]|nr:hypothetical protein B0H14DRAFT_3089398 [Mycena olivaceomarginata]